MKAFIIICFVAIYASAAFAEIYKWEDANGIHITDNASSVPKKYREKVYSDTQAETKKNTPQTAVGINKLNIPAITTQYQAAAYQANLDRQRQTAEAMRQQQARALAASTKNLDNALQPLARFMAKWLLIGFIILVIWVATVVDIVRSEFKTPSNKTVWTLMVIFLPLLGMGLYYIFGLSQKCISTGYKEKQRAESLVRLYPRDSKDKDFVIK